MPTLTARRKSPPKPRRARGTGAFFWAESAGVYIGRVKIGKKPDGTPFYVERRAPTQAELQKKLAAIAPPNPQSTLAAWSERWFQGLGVRASTRDDYRRSLDRFILPTLGHYRVVDLTPHQIEFAARQWASAGQGPNTVRKLLAHLHACLSAARRAKLRPDNPAGDIRRPRSKRKPIDIFTPPELLAIIEVAAERSTWRLFAALASIGCRPGEALAFDVTDYAEGRLSITKTYSRAHGTRPPKTENGVRTVRVPAAALPAVQPRGKSGPLFPSRTAKRRDAALLHVSWRLLLTRLGLRYRNPHQLRHSVASASLAAGVPIADVARDLGDSPETIMRTYIHPTGVFVADAMDRLFAAQKSGG